MIEPTFAAARRTSILVDRDKELNQIGRAIHRADASTQVVFVLGKGGLGKTRLLEEITKNPRIVTDKSSDTNEKSTRKNKPIISEIIDLQDTALHARLPFIQLLRETLRNTDLSDFPKFDDAYSKYQRLTQQSGEFQEIDQARAEAESGFLQDLKKNTARTRLVIPIDTAEQLASISSAWLLDNGLLTSQDLAFNTQQWLANQIQAGAFPNVTLIFAGRDEEGKRFFDVIEAAIKRSRGKAKLAKIVLKNFSASQTHEFFQILAADWNKRLKDKNETGNAARVAKTINNLASDEKRSRVLWLYTGGQPVRLSLYTDLIIESDSIPEPLRDTWEQALDRIKTDDPTKNRTPELEAARRTIQNEFISLLFSQPSLRSQILTALVRARRGLGTEQVHYVFHAGNQVPPEKWEKQSKSAQENASLWDIEKEFDALQELSMIKERVGGRLGLQDEIYRIYAEQMLAQDSYKQVESKARERLYERLHDWAVFQRDRLSQARRELQTDDEKHLTFDSPAHAVEIRFPALTESEQMERSQIFRQLREWELERLHYSLLLNPATNLNDVYYDLAERWWRASDMDTDARTQAELRSVLEDPYALQFASLEVTDDMRNRNENPIDVLLRAAQQEDVTRWIKRFVLQNRYHDAIKFCDRVQAAIDRKTDPNDKKSWNHTFARAERTCWREYARILIGHEITDAIQALEVAASHIVAMANTNRNTVAILETGEHGFVGHPAEDRLKRVGASTYNYIGYGYTQLANYRKGVEMYGESLKYTRETNFIGRQAQTRNNLSRALSEMGRVRSRRVCLDGLELSRQQGIEKTIALGLNTLGLIDNDQFRPDLAWIETATALAYFRRNNDQRGQGLALIQLGESLRRLANLALSPERIFRDPPELIYEGAASALSQAIAIFRQGAPSEENQRLIEAKLEMGCLQRDRIQIARQTPDAELWRKRRYDEALDYLEQAADEASAFKLKRLELDARVNIAWTHYQRGYHDQTERAAQKAEELISDAAFIRHKRTLPLPTIAESYVYIQLSKLCNLRGSVALDLFRRGTDEIEAANRRPLHLRREQYKMVHEDAALQELLKKAAEQFVLGSGYAQLYSPRSSALSVLYNTLYGYLKKFNQQELEDFYQYEHYWSERYRTSKIQLEDLGNLDIFLSELFGSRPGKGTSHARKHQ